MKKKLLALVMVVLTAIMMIGCSKTGLSLLDEFNKFYAWEASEYKGDVVFTLEAGGVKVNVTAEMSGYANQKENSAEATLVLKKLEAEGEVLDLSSEIKLSPIKVMVKDNKVYMSKSYFEDLFNLTGMETTKEFKAITSEYIGIDYPGLDLSKELNTQYLDMFKDIKTDIEIAQNDRTYTIELTDEKLIEAGKEFITVFCTSDLFKASMIATGQMTEEDFAELEKELTAGMDEVVKTIQPMIKGSNAKVEYKFADDSLKMDDEFNLVLTVDEEKVAVNCKLTADYKKAVAKEVKVPEGTVVYTMDELTDIMTVKAAYFDESEVIVKGNTIYVPLKDAMSQLEIPVKYDGKTKTTSIVVDGKTMKVTTKVIEGTSYVTPATLKKLGFTYESDEEYGLITITQN